MVFLQIFLDVVSNFRGIGGSVLYRCRLICSNQIYYFTLWFEIIIIYLNGKCVATLETVPKFLNYVWTKDGSSNNVIIDNDTTYLAVINPGTYHVLATDENGCTATASITIPSFMFSSGCITDSHNQMIVDSFAVNLNQMTSDINLLAKGLTGLKNDSTIKALVKNLASST